MPQLIGVADKFAVNDAKENVRLNQRLLHIRVFHPTQHVEPFESVAEWDLVAELGEHVTYLGL